MKMVKTVLGIIILTLLVIALPGCGESESDGPSGEPEYASEATETTLQGLSENDLDKYIRYGNPEFKAAVTQEVLDAAAAQIEGQLGAYESIEFLYTEKQGVYTLVHYKAKYAKGEVGIKMVFDEDHMVAGQWFE
jgi:uncharacterized lipoprotein YehR (DUF1307 family)